MDYPLSELILREDVVEEVVHVGFFAGEMW